MLTKHKANLIRQLHEKKYRTESKLFLVEGEKNVSELISSHFKIHELFISPEFFEYNKPYIQEKNLQYTIVEQAELEGLSTFKSNNAAVAVVQQQKYDIADLYPDQLIICLDTINDPGNLGTIIRTADWYGITTIVASYNTADLYNSKVIAASMGSFLRVKVYYTDLASFFSLVGNSSQPLPVIGTFLEGADIHTFSFPQSGILLMGNESHGISEPLFPFVTNKITIPSFGRAESLNVALATGIILDNWKRTSK